jgi:hypothetical protein
VKSKPRQPDPSIFHVKSINQSRLFQDFLEFYGVGVSRVFGDPAVRTVLLDGRLKRYRENGRLDQLSVYIARDLDKHLTERYKHHTER